MPEYPRVRAGLRGPAGPIGPATEWRSASGYLQYRALGSSTWTNAVALSELGGASGFNFKGTKATTGALPTSGNVRGDLWIVTADLHGRAWDGTQWVDVGSVQGPQGPTGPAGANGTNGTNGAPGVGVAPGGATGQVLAKSSNADYATAWVNPSGEGGAALVSYEQVSSLPDYPTELADTANAVPKTAFDAKGDLIVGTAADTVARLPAGADGTVLRYDSTQPTGFNTLDPDQYATKAGSIRQFTDVADGTPNEGDMTTWDAETQQWVAIDPTTRFAQTDPSTGQLAPASYPAGYRPLIVINEGEQVPAGTPAGAIIFSRPAAASTVPVLLGTNTALASSTIAVTTSDVLTVGSYLGIALMVSNEVGSGAFASATVAYSAGVAPVTWVGLSNPNTTAAVLQGYAKVTTQIPAGATVTLTLRDATPSAVNRTHSAAAVYRLPNIASTSPLDQTAIGGGTSSSNMTAVTAGPTASPTVQANEVAVALAGWSSLVSPASRDLAVGTGWTQLAKMKADNGTSARSLLVAFRVLTTTGQPQFTTTMTSTDGSTGAWATDLATFKAA